MIGSLFFRNVSGVSARRERLRRAECNKAPSMYEMEGALCGLAAPDRPVARLPRRCAPPARAKHPREPPVSRPFPRPWVAPGWCPFPTVNVFLPSHASVAQEPTAIHFEFFLHPHVAHRKRAVIRTLQRLSTALYTNHPQVTRESWRISSFGLSRRPSVADVGMVPGAGAAAWLRARSARSARRGRSGRRGPGDRRGPGGVPVPRAPPTAMSPRFAMRRVNTIALSRETTYHRYMTTRQAQKRDGHMNPLSRLEAALIGGVVAV